MVKTVLLGTVITAIGTLGLLLDAQSKVPVVRQDNDHPVGPSVIFASGRIEGSTPEIELRSRLDGRIEQLLVEEGQFVQKGDALLKLDDRQYLHEVELARAEVALAEAQLERLVNGAHRQQRAEAAALYRAKLAELERAELCWRRIDKLGQTKTVSQQSVDNQRTMVVATRAEVEAAKARLGKLEADARADEVNMANARIRAAKARLELAKVQLDKTKLRAPSRGQILKIGVEAGELTGPASAEPAVVLVDTSTPYVRAFVEELDAPRVKVGMTARIVIDGLPQKDLKGRVTRLSPRMCRKQLWSDRPAERYDTKTRQVWIRLEEADGLVVGLRADVEISPEARL